MSKFLSRIVSPTYTAPTTNVAVGVFSVTQQLQARQSNTWPLPPFSVNYLVIAGGGGGLVLGTPLAPASTGAAAGITDRAAS